jgi:hypothetical protein
MEADRKAKADAEAAAGRAAELKYLQTRKARSPLRTPRSRPVELGRVVLACEVEDNDGLCFGVSVGG